MRSLIVETFSRQRSSYYFTTREENSLVVLVCVTVVSVVPSSFPAKVSCDSTVACVPGCGGNAILRYASMEFFFHNCLITNDLKSARLEHPPFTLLSTVKLA